MSEYLSGEEISGQKNRLRREMLQKRRQLSEEQRERLSRKILEHLYREPVYDRSKTVMAYMSMPDEVQIGPLLEDCLRKGKRPAIPLIVGKGQMEAVLVPSMESLTEGAYGILTVREELRRIVPPEQIDCVIVPGTAFSGTGERLGLGGGFYDRFLRRCPNAHRIALAFSFQLVEKLPTEQHDIKVDQIITERNSEERI